MKIVGKRETQDEFIYCFKFISIRQNKDVILECFKEYMGFSVGKTPSQKEFLMNIEEKENDPNFIGDMEGLLRSGIDYDQEVAFEWLKTNVLKIEE